MALPSRHDATARLRAFAYPLAAAFVSLFLAWLLFDLPLAFAAAASLLILAAAAWAPPLRKAAGERGRGPADPDAALDGAARAVLSALPRPAFLLDAAGTVRFANDAAVRQFGATRPGDPFTLTFRSPEVRAALENVAAAPVVELRETGRPGRLNSLALNPVNLPGEAEPSTLVTITDESERVAIARMRADFVANASHELRTPLSSLAGFIETLLGPARNDPHAAERFLPIMQEQAGRMRRLIDDLLSLSRAEMRQHRMPTDKVDLLAVVREAADTAAALAAEYGVSLDVRLGKPVSVLGDRDELHQVFGNLLENAIRYGGSGGRVEITSELRSEGSQRTVAVHVQDFGPGIPEEHLPRLTERFYRVDVGASREMKGTGLGLAIVKHILTRHGARLAVESRPGEGARFTVLLPVSDADATRSAENVRAAAL